jgi:hypothetical protein
MTTSRPPPANRSETGRNLQGQFVAGSTGNPHGRPKTELAVRQRLAELTPQMIEEWRRIALDPKERTCDRLRAQENIVYSSIGRPAQRIDAAVTVAQLRPIAIVSPNGEQLKVIDVEPSE